MNRKLQIRVEVIGRELIETARKAELRLNKKHRLETTLLDWCMDNPNLRTHAFQLIDVFPDLKKSTQLAKHVQEYFPNHDKKLPAALRHALKLTHPISLTGGVVKMVANTIYQKMAQLFIGTTQEIKVAERLEEFGDQNVKLSIDLLGEATMSQEEADNYLKRYQDVIRVLSTTQRGVEWQNTSVKLSSLDPRFDPHDFHGTSIRLRTPLRKLLRSAKEHEVFINIDMEEYAVRDLTLRIVQDILAEDEFKDGCHIGIVLQSCLKDSLECLDKILEWSKPLPIPLTIRLVRGAYWDTEIMNAQNQHWEIPVFTQKEETDKAYEACVDKILGTIPNVKLAVATHNIRSIAYTLAQCEERSIPEGFVEYQLLYGMGNALMESLLSFGISPRIYFPIGDSVKGMAYLVRRLLENVSAESFLRRVVHIDADITQLLKAPKSVSSEEKSAAQEGFQPTPPLELFKVESADEFKSAVKSAPKHFPKRIPLLIDGKQINLEDDIPSLSPLNEKNVITYTTRATKHEVNLALEAAEHSCEKWSNTSVEERAQVLIKAAQFLKSNRYMLAAAEIYDVGKSWDEADADIVEAIDALNFYAHQALKDEKPRLTEKLADEKNILLPRPRGVAVIISPWNFPIAIPAGMCAAALVTGNTVIFKPAEQSPLSGWKLTQAFIEAGIPKGVFNFLTGMGDEIGPWLVEDPRTSLIAFTGSKEVGLEITQRAGKTDEASGKMKKLIVEMGGKNACIIDETADLDAAIPSILTSAFNYAGQKCSALSRLIVLDSVYEACIDRLIKAAAIFPVGDPREPLTKCGPVIDKAAFDKISRFLEEGRKSGKILFQSKFSEAQPEFLNGNWIPPTIIGELPPNSPLLQDEIFGPILTVIRAKNFKNALRIANSVKFGLTGGVFSRTPSHIEQAKKEFEVGNLYINRGITGALIRRQPFGGLKLSGDGTKAGSAEYLHEFYIDKTISENISRHGFAPLE